MKSSPLPIVSMGVAAVAAVLPAATTQAACITFLAAEPVPDGPLPFCTKGLLESGGTCITGSGSVINPPSAAGGSRASIQSGLSRAAPLATSGSTTTSDTNAAATSTTVSNPNDPACLAESFGAPLVAQGLVQTRGALNQALAQLLDRRAQPHAARGTTLYGYASDQSRREGGNTNTNTGTSALRASRTDLTLGADYRLSEQWVLGGAAGFGTPRLRWGGNTPRIDGQSTTLTSYASFSPTAASYIAAALGVEGTRYTLRNSKDTEPVARTHGVNWGLSVSAGHDFSFGNWGMSPYARVDEVYARVGRFGSGGRFSTGRTGSVSAGNQIQTQIPMSWGVFAPHARVEFTQITGWHLRGDSAQAHAAGVGIFPVNSPWAIDRQFGQFGVGAAAVLQRGLTVFTDYDTGFAQKGVSSWRYTLGVRSEL